MNITVKWNGTDVPVTLAQVETGDFRGGFVEGLLRGSFIVKNPDGDHPITIRRNTRRIDDALYWDASIESPIANDEEPELNGHGDSAQEAVDALAVILKYLARWAFDVLHPGEERLHLATNPRDATACNAIGRLRYTHDLALFKSLIDVVPTCEECVETLSEDQDSDEADEEDE